MFQQWFILNGAVSRTENTPLTKSIFIEMNAGAEYAYLYHCANALLRLMLLKFLFECLNDLLVKTTLRPVNDPDGL